MLLELNIKEEKVKNININYKEFSEISNNDFIKKDYKFEELSFDIIIDDLLENIFLFENNLRSFNLTNNDHKIFYLKSGLNSPWQYIVQKDFITIEVEKGKYNLDMSSINIFKEHLGDILFVNKPEGVDFTHIYSSIKKNIKEIYGENYNEIIIIQYMIKNEISCVHINDFNISFLDNFKSLEEFYKLVFKETPLFNEYKDIETATKELILKETFSIEISSLKRYSSLFGGKLNMPGLYLYKYLINYLRILNKESIPARVLKKRGRKKKLVEPSETDTPSHDGVESSEIDNPSSYKKEASLK